MEKKDEEKHSLQDKKVYTNQNYDESPPQKIPEIPNFPVIDFANEIVDNEGED